MEQMEEIFAQFLSSEIDPMLPTGQAAAAGPAAPTLYDEYQKLTSQDFKDMMELAALDPLEMEVPANEVSRQWDGEETTVLPPSEEMSCAPKVNEGGAGSSQMSMLESMPNLSESKLGDPELGQSNAQDEGSVIIIGEDNNTYLVPVSMLDEILVPCATEAASSTNEVGTPSDNHTNISKVEIQAAANMDMKDDEPATASSTNATPRKSQRKRKAQPKKQKLYQCADTSNERVQRAMYAKQYRTKKKMEQNCEKNDLEAKLSAEKERNSHLEKENAELRLKLNKMNASRPFSRGTTTRFASQITAAVKTLGMGTNVVILHHRLASANACALSSAEINAIVKKATLENQSYKIVFDLNQTGDALVAEHLVD